MLAACGIARNSSSAGRGAAGCARLNAVAPTSIAAIATSVVRMAGILAPFCQTTPARRHGTFLAPSSFEQRRVTDGDMGKGRPMETKTLDELAMIREEDEASIRQLQGGRVSFEERFLQCQSETRGEFST